MDIIFMEVLNSLLPKGKKLKRKLLIGLERRFRKPVSVSEAIGCHSALRT
jgi:hypothetical protein